MLVKFQCVPPRRARPSSPSRRLLATSLLCRLPTMADAYVYALIEAVHKHEKRSSRLRLFGQVRRAQSRRPPRALEAPPPPPSLARWSACSARTSTRRASRPSCCSCSRRSSPTSRAPSCASGARGAASCPSSASSQPPRCAASGETHGRCVGNAHGVSFAARLRGLQPRALARQAHADEQPPLQAARRYFCEAGATGWVRLRGNGTSPLSIYRKCRPLTRRPTRARWRSRRRSQHRLAPPLSSRRRRGRRARRCAAAPRWART